MLKRFKEVSARNEFGRRGWTTAVLLRRFHYVGGWIAVAGAVIAAGVIAARHAGAATAGQAAFDDVSAEIYLRFNYQHPPTSQKYLVETMGGGVALFDYDNDGRLFHQTETARSAM